MPTHTTSAGLEFFYAKLTNSRAEDGHQIGSKEMKYKCKCREFKLAKTTSIIVNGKIETAEAFCEECKTFGKFVKEHKGFGGIIKKPDGTVSKKF